MKKKVEVDAGKTVEQKSVSDSELDKYTIKTQPDMKGLPARINAIIKKRGALRMRPGIRRRSNLLF